MNIPIQNIYYLLCYAWDALAEREVVSVDAREHASLVDLFARVLLNGVHHLLKRGFDRGYVEREEWTGRLRGRVEFTQALNQGKTMTARLPCAFAELSYDVLHNRILKSTIWRLIRTPRLSQELIHGLSALERMFSEISEVPLNRRVFGQIQLHRNNQFYNFLLRVCELLHTRLLVTEDSGSNTFMDFERDPERLAALFEDFVRNFYRTHTRYSVKREYIRWRWVPENMESARLMPRMETDICLTSEDSKIIIECKFTPEVAQIRRETEKLRSAHLYQIHAYLANLPRAVLNSRCRMILLYPTVANPLMADFRHEGRRISVRTINLNQDWQGIHRDLLEFVGS